MKDFIDYTGVLSEEIYDKFYVSTPDGKFLSTFGILTILLIATGIYYVVNKDY